MSFKGSENSIHKSPLLNSKHLRIGVDIDEVLCRTNDYFLKEFNKNHNTDFKREQIKRYNFDCFEEYSGKYVFNKLVEHLKENLSEYEIVKDAKEVLSELKKENHLFIITSRQDFFKEKTLSWLNLHFEENFFENILFLDDFKFFSCKSEICNEYKIDVLIEDAPNHAINTSQNGIKVLLMDCPWNRDIKENKNLIRVKNWKEIKTILE